MSMSRGYVPGPECEELAAWRAESEAGAEAVDHGLTGRFQDAAVNLTNHNRVAAKFGIEGL